MKTFHGLLLLTAAASASAKAIASVQQRASNWTIGQVVQTSSGPVTGHPATNQSQVSAYLGIPYAQPPIGNLRFAAPVRYNGTTAINGTSFGPACPVKESNSTTPSAATIMAANITVAGLTYTNVFGETRGLFNEDCLYANVWTAPQTGEAKKAVLVWIYGGGFTSGSGSIPGYNGANIAAQEDVVVVSFNYRLSILGFPGSPSTANNLAFLDQRLAVEWVRDNIAAFGGDPSRITLFGQSAGGWSVDAYTYAWASDPIAAGFIPESGNVFSWGLPASKSASAAAWYALSTKIGCGNLSSSDAAAVLSCMRTKPYQAILNAVPTVSGANGILGTFGPTADETVVFSNYTGRTPANRPMLIGSNNYEAGLFRTSFALANITYPDAFWDVFNLQEFTCPAGIRANASLSFKNPTWRYRYFGVFPNTAISTEAGAFHAAELPILFNTLPPSPPSTTEQISIGNYMRGAWAAFAKDPVNGLTTYGWPSYNPSGDTLLRLAYNNVTGTNLANPSLYDANCKYVNVSSTDASQYPNIPSAVAPTATSGGSSPTGSTTGTPAATSKVSGGIRLSSSSFMVLMAIVTAFVL
ncbi:Alpha/Beta hydrolase protein [Tricladium varicosporioides]|nr:Alpha/Beta hydrolase protein [Hymenoscyphus varicosporioides]